MKKISKRLLLAAGIMCISLRAAASIPCSFIDLVGHEAIVYDPFLGLLKITQFEPTYVGLHTFVDDPVLIERVATEQKGLFLVVAADLLANINVSPIGAKLKQLLARVAKVPNFFVCLLLPNFNGVHPNMALLPALRDLFAPLGISTQPVLMSMLEQRMGKPMSTGDLVSAAIDFFLKNPLSSRPMLFHTTLSGPHEGRHFTSRVLQAAQNHPELSLTLLPAHAKRFVSKKLAQTLPYFLYTYSHGPQLHVLVGSEMLVGGLGITEQFHIRPLKTSYTKEMLELIGFSMAQFHGLVTKAEPKKKNFHAVVRHVVKPDCAQVINSFGKPSRGRDKHVLRKVAWMELNIFEPLTAEQAKACTRPGLDPGTAIKEQRRRQAELINYLIKSRFDGLWITFNPHQYWSPIARKKDKEQSFLSSVQLFTRQLAAACKRAKKQCPALLVGFEITNNVYQPNLPKMCAVDTFGNEFNDIPAPLHEQFWQDEVINPLQELARRWQDCNFSNGVPLKGVVLDLEMYCRRRIGSFTPACGFDRETLAAYDAALGGENFSVHNAVQKLMNDGKYGAFLAMRTDRAKQLGVTMRAAFKKALGDDVYVMCYAQNLMIDWFYKGLYRGLSTKEEPLELLTFNAEFMRHRPWLEQQGIYINHGCVVLLSKFASPKEFGYVNYVRQAHQSVWLNRVSRLVEDYEPKSWIAVEQTPMNAQDKLKLVEHLATVW